jgi:rubrerythrin
MELTRVLEAFSSFEKRGIDFYRRFAARFNAPPRVQLLWTEMSNAEAGHFAVLSLTQDWIQTGRDATEPSPGLTPADLDTMDRRLTALEAEGTASDLTFAEAVGLAVEWEEIELRRVLVLLPALPAGAKGRVVSGLVAEAGLHYDCLQELAGLAGAASLETRFSALRAGASQAAAKPVA